MNTHFLHFCAAFFLSFLILLPLSAQRASYDGVESTYFNKSGALRTDGAVSGYYVVNYHKPQKGDGYHVLQLLDQDLNAVGEKSFEDKKDMRIGEVAYNGDLLGVEMIDHEKERKWIEFFNGAGEFQHRRTLKYSLYDTPKAREQMAMFEFAPLVPVAGGFLYFSTETKGKSIMSQMRYRVSFIPNDSEGKMWGSRTSSKSKDHEGAIFLTANEEVAVFSIFKRSGMLSQKFTMEVVGYDLTTGRRRFKYAPGKKEVQTRFIKARIIGDEVVLVGPNVGKSNKLFTESPEGIDILRIGLDGKVKGKKTLSLENDLAGFLDVNGRGKVKGLGNLFIHEVGLTENKDLLIAGEFYRTFNGDLKVEEGVLIQVRPDLSVAEVKVIEKGKTGSLGMSILSGGISLAKGSTIAAIGKANGHFDFAFLNDGLDAVTTAYFSGRSEVRKTKRISLYINTLLDGELMEDKVEFDAASDHVTVLPAKEGYIAVIEYNGDAKSLDLHMERLSL